MTSFMNDHLRKRDIAGVGQTEIQDWISSQFGRVQGEGIVAQAGHDPAKEHYQGLEKGVSEIIKHYVIN